MLTLDLPPLRGGALLGPRQAASPLGAEAWHDGERHHKVVELVAVVEGVGEEQRVADGVGEVLGEIALRGGGEGDKGEGGCV